MYIYIKIYVFILLHIKSICFPISSLRLDTIRLKNYDNLVGEKWDLLLISMFLFLL